MPKTPKKAASKGDGETPKISLNKSQNKVLLTSSTTKKESPKKTKKDANEASQSLSSPSKKQHQHRGVSNSLEVLLPHSLGQNSAAGDCTVLVQIDPDDANLLDFEGATGAIGRFQADEQGILLDLKGSQYQGTILPCATAMVTSLHYTAEGQQQLRIDAMTDEFCPLVKTQDIMAKLDAQIEGTMDESYQLQEEDVNRLAREEKQMEAKEKKNQQKQKQQKPKGAAGGKKENSKPKAGGNSGAKKRASTNSRGSKEGSNNKRQKVSLGKK